MTDTEISGELFLAAISYIETNHGSKAWKKIAGELSKELKGVKIEAQGRYPFALLITVSVTAAKFLKMPTTDFVTSVGFFWISHLSGNPKIKSIFSSLGNSFPTALHSLNSMHNTVSESGLYPNLSCPQLEILSESQGWMKCLYTPGSSVRCGIAQHIMVGIIKGLGYDFFGLTFVDVMISEERPGPITSYVLEVTYSTKLSDDASAATTSISDTNFTLQSCHITSLFPFYFVVDKNGIITTSGPSFQKCFPTYVGKEASSVISVSYPNTASGPFDVGGLSHLSFRLDLCCIVVDGVEMRGQVLFQNESLAYLGNPVFKSVDDMVSRGLSISDFALHDTGISSIYTSLSMETAARKHGKLKKVGKTESKFYKVFSKKQSKKREILGDKAKKMTSTSRLKKRTTSYSPSNSPSHSPKSPPISPSECPFRHSPTPLASSPTPLASSPTSLTPLSPTTSHHSTFSSSLGREREERNESGKGECPFSSSFGGRSFTSSSPVPPLSTSLPSSQTENDTSPMTSPKVPPLKVNKIKSNNNNNDFFNDNTQNNTTVQNYFSSSSTITSEGSTSPRGERKGGKGVMGRQGSGSRLFSSSPFGAEGEMDPYGKFCELFYQDASNGFPFTLELLEKTEASDRHRKKTAEALLDFFSETGVSIELIKITLQKDLLSDISLSEYLRGTTTGVRLTSLFLNRYAGNFISSFCEDLNSLNLEGKDGSEQVTSFLKKRIETHLNPQVCKLLNWIYKTVEKNLSKETASLAITNIFFLRFVLARMVQVSPETKDIAKKIQKECQPHHPFVPEMMEICGQKSYSETNTIANLFRKKISSTHSSGAIVMKEVCFEFLDQLLDTKEGKAMFVPFITSQLGF